MIAIDLYAPGMIALAASRGYDDPAHRAALAAGPPDSDAIGLTHPANFLTENEVEYGSVQAQLWERHANDGHVGDSYVAGCPQCEGWYS